jgi:MFS superfamily sulfate permease-like transporter
VVNVPQAMAHVLLATVNPVYGIYTLMVVVPIGAIFTSSVFTPMASAGGCLATKVNRVVQMTPVPAGTVEDYLLSPVLQYGR